MTVRLAVSERCLTCHEIRTAHLASPDSACAVCHVPLVEAVRLTRADIAAFVAPASHSEAGFAGSDGHGTAASAGRGSCATCHARDFCLVCHVDAPE
ncbi:MAG: hypothetical protein ACREMV_07655, partial [Gemmatimonadales bacterium]